MASPNERYKWPLFAVLLLPMGFSAACIKFWFMTLLLKANTKRLVVSRAMVPLLLPYRSGQAMEALLAHAVCLLNK